MELLNTIKQGCISNRWKNTPEPNGETVYPGRFYELEYCKFRFMPMTGYMKNRELVAAKDDIAQEEQQPVIIAGIAAYYIHFLDLDWNEVCENYYNNCFSNFKNYAHGRIEYDDAELNGTLEAEFLKVHIQHELKCKEITTALFDYIFDDDIKRIDKRQNDYMKFLYGKDNHALDIMTSNYLKTTPELEDIFFNDKVVLQKFLRRIKGFNKCSQITREVYALVDDGKIDESKVNKQLHDELDFLGYCVTKYNNWNGTYNNCAYEKTKLKDKLDKIKEAYK